MIFFNLIGLIIACIILIQAGSWAVKSLVKISLFLEISEFTVGFIIMAVATSLPELFVGISSSLNNVSNLSLGDILGSNIINLTLVIGLTTLIAKKITLKGKIIPKNIFIAFFLSLLPIILLLDGQLSRTDGIVLIASFIAYVLMLIKQKKYFEKSCNDQCSFKDFLKSLGKFVIAVIVLLIAANFIVKYAISLAMAINIPIILIGVILVSLSTSLPELVFEIKAVSLKKDGMALGDITGSTVINSSFILGIVALINPIKIESYFNFLSAAIFLIIIFLVFGYFIKTKNEMTSKEALILIFFYIIFIISELGSKYF